MPRNLSIRRKLGIGSRSSKSPQQPASSQLSSSQPTGQISATKSIWEEALDKVSVEDKDLIKQFLPNLQQDTTAAFESLVKAAQNKLEECRGRQWRVHVRGTQIELHEIASSVVTFLDKVKAAGDVAVNASPLAAGLPWAGIRILLQAKVKDREQMTTLLRVVQRTMIVITRCIVYESLYVDNKSIPEVARTVRSALVNLYSHTLALLCRSVRVFTMNSIKRVSCGFWEHDVTADLEKNLLSSEEDVQYAVTDCDRLLADGSRKLTAQNSQTLANLLQELKDIRDPLKEFDAKLAALWQSTSESKRKEILDWTSQITWEDDHQEAKKDRATDTCDWFITREEYITWLNMEKSGVLWLHGIPGAGKTKLVTKAIDHIAELDEKTMAFFYCKRRDPAHRSLRNILHSLVKQLSIQPKGGALHVALTRNYNMKMSTSGSNELSIDECISIIQEEFQSYSETVIVIDGLDECEKDERQSLLSILFDIMKTADRVKLLIASRRDDDIKNQLNKHPHVSMEATDNEDDIGKFVTQWIMKNEKHRRVPLSDTLKDKIKSIMSKKSKGMFLWAALQLRSINSIHLEQDIRSRLGNLPPDLEGTYGEILTKIERLPGPNARAIAMGTLRWIAFSIKPLKSSELILAVCMDSKCDSPDQLGIDVQFIVDICQNLVEIDSGSDTYRFCHLSVQEYLEKHLNINSIHARISIVCLTMLCNAENQQYMKRRKMENITPGSATLLRYAALFWPDHVRGYEDSFTSDVNNDLSGLLELFLGSVNISSDFYRTWYRFCEPENAREVKAFLEESLFKRFAKELKPVEMPVLGMCVFGFYHVIQAWWQDESIDTTTKNEKGDSLLYLAIISGNENVVRTLIETGANVHEQRSCEKHAREGAGWKMHLPWSVMERRWFITLANIETLSSTLLVQFSGAYSCCGGLLEIVAGSSTVEIARLLIRSGADVNQLSGPGRHGSPLGAATFSNSRQMVKMLLSEGADPNMELTGTEFGSALVTAAARPKDSESFAQLLIDHGADVIARLSTGRYGNALIAASALSLDPGLVKMLVEAGADPNTLVITGDYGSALSAAVSSGNLSIVTYLIDQGANVNAKLSCGEFGHALAATVEVPGGLKVERAPIFDFLISHGADINLVSGVGEYQHVLVGALSRDSPDTETLKFLVNRGADVNIDLRDSWGFSPLALAAHGHKKHMEKAEYLIQMGANVNAQSSSGSVGSVLATASLFKNTEMIRLLVRYGVDINAYIPNKPFASALITAIFSQHVATVKLLVELGADVNMQYDKERFGNALVAAAGVRKPEIMQFLLASGADVNADLIYCPIGHILMFPTLYGDPSMVKLLLENGADVNTKPTHGLFSHVLEAAVRGEGSDESKVQTMQLLIDYGVDVNVQLSGEPAGSPLALATLDGELELIQLLLDAGADPTMPLSKGEYSNALEAAKAAGHPEIQQVLESCQLPYFTETDAAT